MSLTQRVRVGLRREVVILLPIALLLLVLLSTFTLFAYRGAVSLMVDEAHRQALETANRLTTLFSSEELPPSDSLRYLSARVVRVALIDSGGLTVFEKGPQTGEDLLDEFDPNQMRAPTALGPSTENGWVSAIAPLSRVGERHFVRVDLDDSLLGRQVASLRILTWVVLSVNAGLSIVVLLFLRHLLTPIDRFLERARQLLPESRQVEDEVAFLVSSFESALDALSARDPDARDELVTLERTLGPSLESGLLLVGLEEEVLALNPAGAAILGVTSPPRPVPLSELLASRGEGFHSIIREALTSSSIIQRRETLWDEGNSQLTLGMSVNPLRRDDGTIRAFLVLFADLTESRRKEEEEQVAASLAQVGELAAGVAHEMRNSLATFRGYLTLVERSPEDDSITDYLTELRRETDHLHRVLEDFLSFARPESTRLESIDLSTIVRRAAADPALEGYALEISATRAQIKGDAQLLERAIRNLLHNAVQAAKESSSNQPVEVGMETADGRVRVIIADRGKGISPDVQDSLFQPFVTSKGSGVGLGLALAHRIVHLHAGRLTLENRNGGGALALLELPLAMDSEAAGDGQR